MISNQTQAQKLPQTEKLGIELRNMGKEILENLETKMASFKQDTGMKQPSVCVMTEKATGSHFSVNCFFRGREVKADSEHELIRKHQQIFLEGVCQNTMLTALTHDLKFNKRNLEESSQELMGTILSAFNSSVDEMIDIGVEANEDFFESLNEEQKDHITYKLKEVAMDRIYYPMLREMLTANSEIYEASKKSGLMQAIDNAIENLKKVREQPESSGS